jgi:hypothetical protein
MKVVKSQEFIFSWFNHMKTSYKNVEEQNWADIGSKIPTSDSTVTKAVLGVVFDPKSKLQMDKTWVLQGHFRCLNHMAVSNQKYGRTE